jgi:hypothetical protein
MKICLAVLFLLLCICKVANANEVMRIDAHLWNDHEGQPHIGGAISNTTSGTFVVLDFGCGLAGHFGATVHYAFPRTIYPGQTQLFDLIPAYATKEFAAAIARQKPNEKWECSSAYGVTPDGRRIKLSNFVAPPPPMP